jgi:hypothetical protein
MERKVPSCCGESPPREEELNFNSLILFSLQKIIMKFYVTQKKERRREEKRREEKRREERR